MLLNNLYFISMIINRNRIRGAYNNMLSNKPYLFRAFYQWILDNSWTPILTMHADYLHCKVPKELIEEKEIVLNIEPSAIRDLEINDKQITFKASFHEKIHFISSPIEAIICLCAQENGEGVFFDSEEKFNDEPKVTSDNNGEYDFEARMRKIDEDFNERRREIYENFKETTKKFEREKEERDRNFLKSTEESQNKIDECTRQLEKLEHLKSELLKYIKPNSPIFEKNDLFDILIEKLYEGKSDILKLNEESDKSKKKLN